VGGASILARRCSRRGSGPIVVEYSLEILKPINYAHGMEKRKPHHALEDIHALVRAGALFVTMSAQRSAENDFGLDEPGKIAPYILALTRQDFFKSMTTYHDQGIWQDVYHTAVEGIAAYVKIQISSDEEAVVISFKQRDT